MLHIYLDSSALVKRYSLEPGTQLLNVAFQEISPGRLACSAITILEVFSILVRKRNDGRLMQGPFERAFNQLEAEVIQNDEFVTLDINPSVLSSALSLIAQHNINSSDAIILSSALTRQHSLQLTNDNLMFWASDKRLLRAAQAEGLTVFDPEIETLLHLQTLLGIQTNS